jgi:hypothetical protein
MSNASLKKDIILQNIFSSSSWTNPSDNNKILLKQIEDSYYNELKNYNYIHSINDLKDNVQCGGLIRYFTYDGEIRYGGILLKKILIKKNGIDDAILLLKNSQGQTWKLHFNNFMVFYNKNSKNEDLRDLFINYLPDSAKEEYNI